MALLAYGVAVDRAGHVARRARWPRGERVEAPVAGPARARRRGAPARWPTTRARSSCSTCGRRGAPPCRDGDAAAPEDAREDRAARRRSCSGSTPRTRSEDALGVPAREATSTFPSLRDRDREYGRELGVSGYPETFLIDRKGRIAAAAARPGHRRSGSTSTCRRCSRRAREARSLALVLVLGARGAAAEPQATLPDIEDEVMCVECGTALNVSTRRSPTRSARSSARRIAEGMTKAQIKAALVDEYGPDVLAEPERRRLRPRRLARAGRARGARRARRRAARRAAGGATDDAPPPGRSSTPTTRAGSTPSWRLRPMSGGVDTTVIAAFAVGFVSFISPCVLPLVPGYLSAVSGVSLAEIQQRREALRRDPAAGDRLLPVVHRRLRRARDDRHRARLDAAGRARHARQDRRRGDHRARRAVPAHAVRAAAQPRVAPGRADRRAPARAAR